MKTVYLFQRKSSKVTHAVETKHASLGTFELDRLFGGGFTMPCGRPCTGKGVLSENPMSVYWVTCKQCRWVLRIGNGIPPKAECWPPKILRQLDRPRILGIPG